MLNNIAHSLDELRKKLSKVLETSEFQINRIDFDQQDSWIIRDGIMSHKSGGYFHVIGVQNTQDQTDNLFLFQPQSAITGILLHKMNGQIYVMVQARIEPGNTGVLQLGPTIQSTPANFLRAHGGKSTLYLDFFYSSHKSVLGFNSSNHIDVGKLYFHKSKLLNYALVDHLMETEHTFYWTPLSVLLEAAKEDYFVNTDLRSLLGVYDWDSLLGIESKKDFEPSKILEYYLMKRSTIHCSDRYIPIDKSEHFCITDNSIYSKANPNSEIVLYSIGTKHREVSEWVQPLWKANDKGRVLLLCRNWDSDENLEILLTVKEERGVAGKYCVSPSLLTYPNENINKEYFNTGETIHEFYQNDEGGRFINHDYLFRVAQVDQHIELAENQFWVNFKELKNILCMHNVPNIHLRNICSVIIDRLNPNAF